MSTAPVSRIAFASALAAVAVASAVAVTIVSYRGALEKRALVDRVYEEDLAVQRAELLLTRGDEEMNEYLLSPDEEILEEVREYGADFRETASTLSVGEPEERLIVRRALAEHEEFVAVFDAGRDRPTFQAKVRVSRQLAEREHLVLAALESLAPLNVRDARAIREQANTSARRALVAGGVAGLLAVAGGLGFALYAIGLVRRLGRHNESLRRLDQMKDEFVASVSHELRTPLTSIRGYLELVRDEEVGELTEEQRRFLSVVDRNAERLLRVVGDLLFVAQLDAGKIDLDKSRVELAELAAEAVQAAVPAADEKAIALTFEPDEPLELEADQARLAQILDNLISNAVKFTPPGGSVDVRAFQADGVAVVEVADTGMGISAEEQELLFERFFRTKSATEAAIQGTGLGLPIVKAIVQAHGGEITVESEPGEGTTFRVELPMALVREVIAV